MELSCLVLLEGEWKEAAEIENTAVQRKEADRAAFHLSFLYCGSLRGFEGPKVVLGNSSAGKKARAALLHGAHQTTAHGSVQSSKPRAADHYDPDCLQDSFQGFGQSA